MVPVHDASIQSVFSDHTKCLSARRFRPKLRFDIVCTLLSSLQYWRVAVEFHDDSRDVVAY